jgi:hypothetical protein
MACVYAVVPCYVFNQRLTLLNNYIIITTYAFKDLVYKYYSISQINVLKGYAKLMAIRHYLSLFSKYNVSIYCVVSLFKVAFLTTG